MMVARCRACDRTDAESTIAGRGGLVYGKAPAQGRVACVCKSCMTAAARVAETVRNGKGFRWDVDGKAPAVQVLAANLTAEGAAALWLSGWTVAGTPPSDYAALKRFTSAQGIDKAVHSLKRSTPVVYRVVQTMDGAERVSMVHGKADNRTAARFALAWVKALALAGAPALAAWNEGAAESIVERANRSNRNVGIASIMAAREDNDSE